MVTYYITSTIYNQIITQTIQEAGYIVDGGECSADIYFLDFVKKNFARLSSIDELIIDLTALKDLDEEVLEALEILKVHYDTLRIVVLATNRVAGDELLKKCCQMSIYDLIVTDDYLAIRNELIYCLKEGKKYKDAMKYKEKPVGTSPAIVKTEVKQVVSKVLVGIASAGVRQGCTHNTIVLANYLRKQGYMVALAEMNSSGAFQKIQTDYDLQMYDNRYFSMAGIDYYPATTDESLGNILAKSYNFILCDCGVFEEADLVTFGKCDVRIIIAGTKPWEIVSMNSVFEKCDETALKGYHFCFNFVPKPQQNDVKSGMGVLKNIWFLNYTEDPFSSYDFPGADIIFQNYFPVLIQPEKKKGLFKKR